MKMTNKLKQVGDPDGFDEGTYRINPPTKVIQNSSCGPNAEKTSRVFDPQAICLTAPDALDGPESHATGEIQPVATLNSIVQLSQNR